MLLIEATAMPTAAMFRRRTLLKICILRIAAPLRDPNTIRQRRTSRLPAPGAPGGEWLAGNEVGSTAYTSNNQDFGFALRHEGHLLQLNIGKQHILFEGFPNQRMDMTDNESTQVNLIQLSGAYQKIFWRELFRSCAGLQLNLEFLWYISSTNLQFQIYAKKPEQEMRHFVAPQ
ncbi:MAG: hypothetical protein WA635_13315 [Gallionella sp.]